MKVTADLNKALLPLIEEDTNATDAPPALFSTEFARKSKVLIDQVKALRATVSSRTKNPSLFKRTPHQLREELQLPERWRLILPKRGQRAPPTRDEISGKGQARDP